MNIYMYMYVCMYVCKCGSVYLTNLDMMSYMDFGNVLGHLIMCKYYPQYLLIHKTKSWECRNNVCGSFYHHWTHHLLNHFP